MRRASRDYTKYLRGSEEMGSGGSGAPHEGPLHAPPPSPPPSPPAPHQPPAASRSMFVALLGLGLGQVVCSVALFLYFRAQVSGRLPRESPAAWGPHTWPMREGKVDPREGRGWTRDWLMRRCPACRTRLSERGLLGSWDPRGV